MSTAIIIGSHRKDSQSGKVGKFIKQRIENQDKSAEIISLEENPLPLYGDDSKAGKNIFEPFRKTLKEASSLVVITPEWNGMATPGIKYFFLHTSKEDVGHKPALLVGVSAGRGGAYPIAEMRSSSYKNPRVLYIPEHLIFRKVEEILNEKIPVNKNDEYMRKRTEFALSVLFEYEKATLQMNRTKLFDKNFGNGM